MYLAKDEKVLYENRPEKNLLKLWFFTRSLWICLFLAFFIFWGVSLLGSLYLESKGQEVTVPPFYLMTPYLLTVLPAALALSLVYNSALKKTFKYTITNQRCVFEGGIIVKTTRAIPFHKITDISITQNIIENALGISRLNIHTASTGQNKPEISFLGLKDPQAPQEVIHENLNRARN